MDPGKVGVDILPEGLGVRADSRRCGPSGLGVGAVFLPVALDISAKLGKAFADFRSQVGQTLVGVGAGVAPDGDHETGKRYANGNGCNDVGGHGRLLAVFVCTETAPVSDTVALEEGAR